ncbi:MAG: beta-lactamase family protein [Cellvibrionaceae bacterium]|nr:beta-lactamase family protein [Cellvibrionaceae bacterium]
MTTIAKTIILLLLSVALCSTAFSQGIPSDSELIGLWEGKRIAGPEIQGDLLIVLAGEQWRVDVAGHTLSVPINNTGSRAELSFSIPGGRGSFSGKLGDGGKQITGHWTQPGTLNNGMPHASPVVLRLEGAGRWRGQIVPLLDEFSLFLPVWKREDGSLGAFLRNPDRGFGVFYNVDKVERVGDSVKWIGKFFRNPNETVLAQAHYQPGRMAVNIRGNLYDMRRLADASNSHFYARGKVPAPYHYTPPLVIPEDGWPIGSLQNANINEKSIAQFIDQVVLKPADSIDDPYIHGILIARKGKLVLEEYFHGFHRNKAHDTRSASKSLAAVLAGAVIHSGAALTLSSPVFRTIHGGQASNEKAADQRRQKINLAHLLSMASGMDCDDRDPQSKGNEDTMQSQQDQLDWYQYTMDLEMVRSPGRKAVYCTAGMNLVGAVLASATGRKLEDLFMELIAKPLQIKHYYLNISPTGQPYLGGGIYWRPRDFMKLGQVMLNGGSWNGRRILSEDYAKKSVSALYTMQSKGYGYGWWSQQYPYKGGQVQAFFAAGNGGQLVMGIPELELLVAFYAGNYSHKTFFRIQQEFVPDYILPALK